MIYYSGRGLATPVIYYAMVYLFRLHPTITWGEVVVRGFRRNCKIPEQRSSLISYMKIYSYMRMMKDMIKCYILF